MSLDRANFMKTPEDSWPLHMQGNHHPVKMMGR